MLQLLIKIACSRAPVSLAPPRHLPAWMGGLRLPRRASGGAEQSLACRTSLPLPSHSSSIRDGEAKPCHPFSSDDVLCFGQLALLHRQPCDDSAGKVLTLIESRPGD